MNAHAETQHDATQYPQSSSASAERGAAQMLWLSTASRTRKPAKSNGRRRRHAVYDRMSRLPPESIQRPSPPVAEALSNISVTEQRTNQADSLDRTQWNQVQPLVVHPASALFGGMEALLKDTHEWFPRNQVNVANGFDAWGFDGTETHFELPPRAPDPYKTFGVLGQGAYGYVDKVGSRQGDGRIYARKLSLLPPRGQRREAALNALREEARIAAALQAHPHVIKIVETFQWGNRFGIVMLPVAQCDLAHFLEEVDHMPDSPERDDLVDAVPRMCGCLVRTLDYVHSQGVRHKDIKPSNILLYDGEVYLTDFGIARDLSDLETTGTTGDLGARSRMYCAPEANNEMGRRGRSADVFSLGCVILELITVFQNGPNCLQPMKDRLRTTDSSRPAMAYSDSVPEVLRWICFLWAKSMRRELVILVILMLHPAPERRMPLCDLIMVFNTLKGASPGDWCTKCSTVARERYNRGSVDRQILDQYCEMIIGVFTGSRLTIEEEGIDAVSVDDRLLRLGWITPQGTVQTSPLMQTTARPHSSFPPHRLPGAMAQPTMPSPLRIPTQRTPTESVSSLSPFNLWKLAESREHSRVPTTNSGHTSSLYGLSDFPADFLSSSSAGNYDVPQIKLDSSYFSDSATPQQVDLLDLLMGPEVTPSERVTQGSERPIMTYRKNPILYRRPPTQRLYEFETDDAL